MSRFEGKVAVVTGGGSGIGRAIALRLAIEGARVAVLDIRAETAEETLALAGGDGVALVCDVSESAGVDAVFDQIVSALGPPDILANNAGRSASTTSGGSRRCSPSNARRRPAMASGRRSTRSSA